MTAEQEAIERLRALIKFAAEDEVSSEGAADIRAIRALLDREKRLTEALEAQGYVIRTVGGTYRWHAEGCAAANDWGACISRCKKGREALEGSQ